jgi:LytS/YehU family sensor histidine kinase
LNWRSIQRVKEKLLREKSILLKELDFIKDQFNSHFTFNFFGYCYNNALHSSSQSTDSIASFTQMLHYSLKNGSNEYIPLTEEIAYIENFINIQNCITDSVYTELIVNGAVEDYCILPGILSTFVENSFKHGVFNQKENPIQIFISLNEDVLSFTVKNKKANKKTFDSTGVGIAEMDEVLKLFYPEKYRLEIDTDNPTDYCLKLDLHLTFMTA